MWELLNHHFSKYWPQIVHSNHLRSSVNIININIKQVHGKLSRSFDDEPDHYSTSNSRTCLGSIVTIDDWYLRSSSFTIYNYLLTLDDIARSEIRRRVICFIPKQLAGFTNSWCLGRFSSTCRRKMNYELDKLLSILKKAGQGMF